MVWLKMPTSVSRPKTRFLFKLLPRLYDTATALFRLLVWFKKREEKKEEREKKKRRKRKEEKKKRKEKRKKERLRKEEKKKGTLR